MTDPRQGNHSGSLKLYFIYSIACGAVLALALVAFRVEGELAERLFAQGLNGSNEIAAARDGERGAGSDGDHQNVADAARLHSSGAPPLRIIARVDEAAVVGLEPPPAAPIGSDVDESATTTLWVPPKGQTFRTVCVRLCDGAMTPVSFSTRRSRFQADAERCEQQCGSPSRLFVYPTTGSQDDLIDLEGRAYRDLETAYKFRTDYDASCGCRAKPWESAALAQHKAWAQAQSTVPKLDNPKSVMPTAVADGATQRSGLAESPVVASLNAGMLETGKLAESAGKPDQTSIQGSARSQGAKMQVPDQSFSESLSGARPQSASKTKRQFELGGGSVSAAAADGVVVEGKVAKNRVARVGKRKVSKKTLLASGGARSQSRVTQRDVVRVAEVVSRRRLGMQRSFRGDDWRISVWEPR